MRKLSFGAIGPDGATRRVCVDALPHVFCSVRGCAVEAHVPRRKKDRNGVIKKEGLKERQMDAMKERNEEGLKQRRREREK